MRKSLHWAAVLTLLTSSSLAQPPAVVRSDPLRRAYYGDLHLHTGYSFDAYLSGTRVTADEAYRFARGESVTIEGAAYQRATAPLDFLAVTDHAEWMNVPDAWQSPESLPFLNELYRKFSAARKESIQSYLKLGWPSNPELPPGADMQAATRAAWQRQIEAANRHYRPGEFTTLLGYEWTSQTTAGDEVVSLHRNVIFRSDNPPAPFTSIDSKEPEALWTFLDRCRSQGHDALAISAHPNLSQGTMFDGADSHGRPMDASYATARVANERLLEITQSNGASEAHPELSPDDEFAGFDLDTRPASLAMRPRPQRGSYARYALSDGMRIAQHNGGINPYRFGFVGTGDFHNGRSESAESAGTYASSGSLTGVWAEQNTRESIFAALRRRETFATSGTRLELRFFGGWDYDRSLLSNRNWLETAYRHGVPMGGDLPARSGTAQGPIFIVQGDKEVDGANLDRLQIVKVWLEGEKHAEKVYDVALSDGRRMDRKTGRVPPVGNTVDPVTATFANTIGSPELAAVWRDPDFDPGAPAAYYLRALEIPTPRMTTFSAYRKGEAPPSDRPTTIQERGWASPIWYTPPAVIASDRNVAREWTFDRNSDREGWSVPERLTGAVMGGALWLTPTPRERDPAVLSSLNYQIYGEWNGLARLLAGEKAKDDGPSVAGEFNRAGPASVDVRSPDNLRIGADVGRAQQLQVSVRLLNLSPASNLDLRWRTVAMPEGHWATRRCAVQSDLKQWQNITCAFASDLRGEVSQIALGISENIIRGDLWIDAVVIEAGAVQLPPQAPDLASPAVVPTLSVPGLPQAQFADAFEVLQENIEIDVPAYGFPFPYIKPAGHDKKYGDYWFYVDGSLSAEAASWTNPRFAQNVMRGVRALQDVNPDGRLVGTPWEAVTGQVGDITNGGPLYFFESAFAIAGRSHDREFREHVFETMRRFLEWYLSPIKRDRATGLITGTHEEALFPVSDEDFGLSYVQTRAPVSLNVTTAVSAEIAADFAAQLGKEAESRRYRQAASELRLAVNTYLWDDEQGLYYDYDLKTKQPIRYLTAATFYPLRLGIAPPERRVRLIEQLKNPAVFNWGKSPVPNTAMTEAPKQNFFWALTNVPIVRGLVESQAFATAAELNWSILQSFQDQFSEAYFLSGRGGGAKRYSFTAAGYITGIIERLFGIHYDATTRLVRIAPLVPPALYNKTLKIDDVLLAPESQTRLSIRVRQRTESSAVITVSLSGELPQGVFEIALPGSGKAITVPAQRSYRAVFR